MPLLAVTATGCGTLVGEETKPVPLAVIRGQVTIADAFVAPAQPVSVALVWVRENDGSDEGVVSQNAELENTFPARFEIVLHEPPPAAAMEDYGVIATTFGCLIAYVDTNGNGHLDLDLGDGVLPEDDLVGGLANPLIHYHEGATIPAQAMGNDRDIPPGFSLIDSSDGTATVLPINTPLQMLLDGTLPSPICTLVWDRLNPAFYFEMVDCTQVQDPDCERDIQIAYDLCRH